MFTILVCGGRNYADIDKLYCALDSVVDKHGLWHPNYPNNCVSQELLIVSGACPRGADAFARDWAGERGARINEYLPNWSKYELRAPSIRNDYIFEHEKVNLVQVFGYDANSEDLIRRAKKARIEVKIIK